MATTDPHGHSHDDDHDHHHGHNHTHDPIEVTEGAGEYEIMVHAIKELSVFWRTARPRSLRWASRWETQS